MLTAGIEQTGASRVPSYCDELEFFAAQGGECPPMVVCEADAETAKAWLAYREPDAATSAVQSALDNYHATQQDIAKTVEQGDPLRVTSVLAHEYVHKYLTTPRDDKARLQDAAAQLFILTEQPVIRTKAAYKQAGRQYKELLRDCTFEAESALNVLALAICEARLDAYQANRTSVDIDSTLLPLPSHLQHYHALPKPALPAFKRQGDVPEGSIWRPSVQAAIASQERKTEKAKAAEARQKAYAARKNQEMGLTPIPKGLPSLEESKLGQFDAAAIDFLHKTGRMPCLLTLQEDNRVFADDVRLLLTQTQISVLGVLLSREPHEPISFGELARLSRPYFAKSDSISESDRERRVWSASRKLQQLGLIAKIAMKTSNKPNAATYDAYVLKPVIINDER